MGDRQHSGAMPQAARAATADAAQPATQSSCKHDIAIAGVVDWLRQEASFARHAQDNARSIADKQYRMGQKDAYLLAADALERGEWELAAPTPGGQEGRD